MRNIYFLLLTLCMNVTLHPMKNNAAIVSTKDYFSPLPDEITSQIIVPFDYNWRKDLKHLPVVAHAIVTLKRTSKSFNTFLSDEKIKLLTHIEKGTKEDLLFARIDDEEMDDEDIDAFENLYKERNIPIKRPPLAPLLQATLNDFLFASVKENAPFFVYFANKAGADVNSYSEEPELTPLLTATLNNDYTMCKLLLSIGANVNGCNLDENGIGLTSLEDTFYPIHIAIQNNNPEMVELFLNAGADKTKCLLQSDSDDVLSTCDLAKKSKNKKIIALVHKAPDKQKIKT